MSRDDAKDRVEPKPGSRCPNQSMPVISAGVAEGPIVDPLSKDRLRGAARRGSAAARRAVGAEGFRTDPDSALVERWQAGDEGAFETLVRRHQGRVYRLLLRMLGSPQEAEDVAQEAFLSLHRHGHRFRREARFSTFLYRVATNAALNRRRSLGRARSREEELVARQAAGNDLPIAPPDPEDSAVGSQLQAQVQAALLELSEDLRAAIVLYDIEGQSYRDIATALDIPEGTVKSRIHRARSALRTRLRAFLRPDGAGDES
jgi:RNA polymerase sigma-70 factor (ECF subfamily)